MAKAIQVNNLSKQYRLGQIGTGSLVHDVNRWWHTVRGKEDPYLQIGEANDRTKKGRSDYVWSLRDIAFDIEQGDSVGIIGRNGAGKSTLLKILSRVTAPTTGGVKVKGRIASLLEVGTGFHPDLSGRDNIYLNGAILGMRKHEITKKFDEIVDFAAVERYIDTPVKRYSSGMYVRLAFAVAAHLESEILIVDEVLAVGDAEFQKKCLGKMGDVSKGEGRTILFVSHNMAAVKSLCRDVIILKNGLLDFQGHVEKGIDHYVKATTNSSSNSYLKSPLIADNTSFSSIKVSDTDGKSKGEFRFEDSIVLRITLQVLEQHLTAKVGFKVFDTLDRCVFANEVDVNKFQAQQGSLNLSCRIPGNILMPSTYKMQFAIHIPNTELLEVLDEVVKFEIMETGSKFYQYSNVDNGCVYLNCDWKKN